MFLKSIGLGALPRASARLYSQATRKTVIPHKKTPRVRYLFGVVVLSFGLLHLVTQRIDKKLPQNSFSEREFDRYEKETGLRRRHKLITSDMPQVYTFHAVPFAQTTTEKLKNSLASEKPVKVIDPADLTEKEMLNEGRYSYLLEELKREGKSMPPGLLTALVKQEVQLFLNTTKGQYDTEILLLNYPQSTEEAIKFENDVSDIQSCIAYEDEQLGALSDDDARKVRNVYGYFDTVDKVRKL